MISKDAMKPSPLKLETAVETCTRLGFKVGDILKSSFWQVPHQIEALNMPADKGDHGPVIHVLRLLEMAPGLWRSGARYPMRYLPKDVSLDVHRILKQRAS